MASAKENTYSLELLAQYQYDEADDIRRAGDAAGVTADKLLLAMENMADGESEAIVKGYNAQ